ncbi:MAG: hypothetical protein QW756_03525 [Nitrososphaerota archaeon]
MAKLFSWRVMFPILIAYMVFYSYFTGLAQLFTLPYPVAGSAAVIGQMVGELYTGPVLQLFWGQYLLNIRLLPIPIAIALSTLFAVNASLLWYLYRSRLLRTCLLGGAGGGLGTIMASVASFSYTCCGWPISLGLMGAGLISVLSPYLTTAALILLGYNAYMLWARVRILGRAGPHL